MVALLNEAMFYPFIIIAGVIAYLCRDNKYKYVGLVLFLEFIFVSAYESYIFDPISGISFSQNSDIAPFYGYKMLMQAVFTIAYIHLNNRILTTLSVMIMSLLGVSTFLALYNIDVAYYEGIMLALSVAQLAAGFGGAVGGYSNLLDNIWSRFIDSRYKRIHK